MSSSAISTSGENAKTGGLRISLVLRGTVLAHARKFRWHHVRPKQSTPSTQVHPEDSHEGAGYEIHQGIFAGGGRSGRRVGRGRGLPRPEGSRLGGARLPLSHGRNAARGAPA